MNEIARELNEWVYLFISLRTFQCSIVLIDKNRKGDKMETGVVEE